MANPEKAYELSFNENLIERRPKDPGSLEPDDFIINDIALRISPQNISIEKESYNTSWETLRTTSARKAKSGYGIARITIQQVFNMYNDVDLMNLVKLVAGLRATPFCVVYSKYLDRSLGRPDQDFIPKDNSSQGISPFQPIMLGLATMSFSTMGHQGQPSCISAIFEFLWFNYLPYTPFVAFKSGENYDKPDYPWRSEPWKAFYRKFLSEHIPVSFPHKPNDSFSRTTEFSWREFVVIPTGSAQGLSAAKELTETLIRKPKEITEILSNIISEGAPNNNLTNSNPDLITSGILDTLFRKAMYKGIINPGSEVAMQINFMAEGAITDASQDVLAPVFRGLMNERSNTRELNLKDAQLALKIITDRIQKAKEFNERSEKIQNRATDNEGFQPVFETNGKTQIGLNNGGLKVLGRKVSYKIGHSVGLEDVDNSVIIEQITVTFQNKLSVIPMVAYRYPTLQHTGNIDATISIAINAANDSVQSIREMYDRIELTALKFRSIPAGYRNLEIANDFLKLFSLDEFLTEKLSVKTNDESPARTNIYLELSDAGLKSTDKDPEKLTQERVTRHASVYEEIWKVMFKNFMWTSNRPEIYLKYDNFQTQGKFRAKNIPEQTPVDRDYYRYKANTIGIDQATNAAYIDLVKRASDIYNDFIVQVHDSIFNSKDGTVKGSERYSALMNLNEKSSRFQYVPGLEQVKSGVRKRNSARKEKGKLHFSVTHTYSRNVKEAAAAKIAENYTGNRTNVDPTKNVTNIADIPAQQMKALNSAARHLEDMGVNKYVLKMTALLKEIQDKYLALEQFAHIINLIQDFGFDIGGAAYPDFTKQLTGVIDLVSDKSSNNIEKVLSNYNPDCYFYYPFYHGGASSDYLGLVDEETITIAQKHSIDLTRSAYEKINKFFQGTYHQRLNNPENPIPYKRLTEDFGGAQIQAEEGVPKFFYDNIDVPNSTRSDKPVKKTYTCDFVAKSSANAYPKELPDLICPNICTHTTDIERMWGGVNITANDPYSSYENMTPSRGYSPLQGIGSREKINLSIPISIPIGTLPPGYTFNGGARNYGGKQRVHKGIDIPYYGNNQKGGVGDRILGTKVFAAADGEIGYIKNNGRIGGLTIGIRHKGNWTTEYMHLQEGSIPIDILKNINWPQGNPIKKMSVTAGQYIAKIGRTGNLNSPTHLHFQVKIGGFKGQPIDPVVLLPDLQKHTKNLRASTTPQSIKEKQDLERIKPLGTDVLTDISSPIRLSIQEFERKLYSGKFQTMMRAYPTFKLYFIEEDVGERKRLAFDDFFSYQSVQSIRVIKDREIAADVCEIYLTNISGILSNRKFNQLKDGDLPRTESGAVAQENPDASSADTVNENPIASMLLQEGVHIHLKLGYQNNPELLTSVFSGIITSVEFSDADDLVCILAQSYAVELVQDIKGIQIPKTKESSVLSFASMFNLNFWGFRDNATTARIFEDMLAEPEVLHFGRWDPKSGGENQVRDLLTQRWTFQPQPQDDNIFAPSEEQDLNTFGNGIIFKDLSYVIYRTTLWDIFQEMTLRHPNYIAIPRLYKDRYGERMTFFFGLPNQLYFHRALTPEEAVADMKLLQAQQAINEDEIKKKIFVAKSSNDATQKMMNYQKVVRNGYMAGGNAQAAVLSSVGAGLSSFHSFNDLYTPASKVTAIQADKVDKTINAPLYAYMPELINTNPYEQKLKEKQSLINDRLILAKKAGYIRPFRNYHLITSTNHLIANNIKANARDVANTIIIKYPKSISIDDEEDSVESNVKVDGEEEFTLKLDNGLPPENTRAQIGQFMNITNDRLAKRYALGMLMRNIKNTYKGEIVITGDPDIELCDYAYLVDEYTDMTGVFEVKSVEHIFDQENGFRTAIKPDMIVHGSEISQLASAEALGIVMESVLHKKNKYDSAAVPMSFSATTLGYGMWAIGGFMSQKLIYYTQLAQPIILSPMQYKGQPFTGGLSLDKISTAAWSTAFGIWAPLTDIGYEDWKEDLKAQIVGSIKHKFFGFTVGKYGNTGGDYPV